jgi:GTP-binding protein
MVFSANTSPFAGKEGKLLTSAVIRDRLIAECENNLTLQVHFEKGKDHYQVHGRGELQLGVLIENMRREGFELSVEPPRVVLKKNEEGNWMEPIEEVIIDIDDEHLGTVMDKMAQRKGLLVEQLEHDGRARLIFEIPTRGLLGYASEFRNDTQGTGVFNHVFLRYDPHRGSIEQTRKGSLISSATGVTTHHALASLEPRGTLFVHPGTKVYTGMVIGECSREGDLDVNATKEKQLNNLRTTHKEEAVRLNRPREMNVEELIAYMQGKCS